MSGEEKSATNERPDPRQAGTELAAATGDLFRKQAVEALSANRWGRPVGVVPPSWSYITWLLTLFVISLAAFISTAQFSRNELVRGRLIPADAEARVFSPEVGVVSKLDVHLGQQVKANDLLAEFVTARQIDGDTSVGEITLVGLQAEKESLEQRRAVVVATAALSRRHVQLELDEVFRDQQQLDESIGLMDRRIEIAKERLETSHNLQEQGAASREEGRAREDTLLAMTQQRAESLSKRDQAITQEQARRVDLRRVDQDLERDLADIDQRIAQNLAQTIKARAENGFVVKAPKSGRIGTLQTAEGERVDPNQPFLTILPDDTRLMAEVYIPSRAIAFIGTGETVRVQYDALPYQKFGTAHGVVESVSRTTQTPVELRAPSQLKDAAYKVTIALDQQFVPAFGKEVALQSGMELTANIVLEKRRLIEWLLEPLIAFSREARGN